MNRTALACLASIALVVSSAHARPEAPPEDLLTAAEASGFTATTDSEDVIRIMDRLARRTPYCERLTIGVSPQGRRIPVLSVGNPPARNPDQAHNSGKLILLVIGSIHAGEVCGKEAMMMLARDIVLDPDAPEHRALLDNCVLLFAPLYNIDGNDDMSPDNRPGQVGPEQGMGTRATSQGYDLNRDYIKLASPEAQAMSSFYSAWNPHLTIDTHTTNGSYHRFTLTYAAPQNPAGHSSPVRFVRDEMLPEISRRLEASTGYRTFFYGNFNRDMTEWRTYPPVPRFGTHYRGLRGRMSILSEAYAYAPFKDRVLCTYAFVHECLLYSVAHEQQINSILNMVERDAAQMIPGTVPIRAEYAAFDEPVVIPGYEMTKPDDGSRPRPTETERDYTVTHFGRFVPSRSVSKPMAYIIPPGYSNIIDKLQQHGIEVTPLNATRFSTIEAYTIDSIARADTPFQKVRTVTIEATPQRVRREIPPEAHVVMMTQPLSNLALYLLEPESEDGLATWDLVDPGLREGDEWPVWRLLTP